jgi:CubicO group peptidase (beta-lactamase class C family)
MADSFPFDGVREQIQALMLEHRLPSVAVAVARDGEIRWEEAFGWADLARRVPATPHTPYSLASISKPITLTGLMILQERGLVDLDAPIDDYLGGVKLNAQRFDARQATLRRVANHTAGLPLHYQFFYADEPYQKPPMEETIRRYATLVSAPGERYQYSNLGTGLLGHVISRVSGKSYPDFMREEVFQPLGMHQSAIDVPAGLEAVAATRYGADGTAYPFYDFDHPAASAVYASAHDLLRFGLFHLKQRQPDQKQVLTDATIEAMRSDPVSDGESDAYGLGWAVYSRFGYPIVGHGGGMGGVSTTLQLLPREKIALVVLLNTGSGTADPKERVADQILGALLPDYAARLQAHRDDPVEERAGYRPSDELLGAWDGQVETYAGQQRLRLWFQPDGDIHAQVDEQMKSLVNNPSFRDGWLAGDFHGRIETPDAQRHPHHLALDLQLRDGRLNGGIRELSEREEPDGGGLGRRVRNAVTHWAELERTAG